MQTNSVDESARSAYIFSRFKKLRYKSYLQCFSYFVAFIILGLILSVYGPTLVALSKKVNVSIQIMGFVFTSRSSGYLLGSWLFGMSFEKVLPQEQREQLKKETRRHFPTMRQVLCLAVGYVIMVTANSLIPFVTNIWLLILVFAALGFGASSLDVAVNIFAVWIWQDSVNPWMQALHFAFGIGSLLCPFMINILNLDNNLIFTYQMISVLSVASLILVIIAQLAPARWDGTEETPIKETLESESKEFLDEQLPEDTKPASDEVLDNSTRSTDVCELEEAESTPSNATEPANTIVRNEDSNIEPATQQEQTMLHKIKKALTLSEGIQVSILLGISLLCIVGSEISFGGIINSYVTEKHIASKTEANNINSAFWLSFTIGRLLGIPLSLMVSPFLMLVVDLIGCFIAIGILFAFPTTKIAIWIGTCLIGASMASQYPTCIGFIGSSMKHIKVTSQMTSLQVILGVVGEMIGPLLITLLFDALGSYSLFTVVLVSLLVSLVAYIILYFGYYKRRKITAST